MQQLSAVRSVQCSAVCSASGDSAVENRDAWCRWEWNGICDSQRVEMDSAAHVGPLITTRHMDDLTATTCTSLTRPDYLLQYRTSYLPTPEPHFSFRYLLRPEAARPGTLGGSRVVDDRSLGRKRTACTVTVLVWCGLAWRCSIQLFALSALPWFMLALPLPWCQARHWFTSAGKLLGRHRHTPAARMTSEHDKLISSPAAHVLAAGRAPCRVPSGKASCFDEAWFQTATIISSGIISIISIINHAPPTTVPHHRALQ